MVEKKKTKSELKEYVSSLLIAVGLALVIRAGVVQAFYIPSGSMEDTLLVGDYLLANKFIYGAPVEIPFTSFTLFRLPGLRDPRPGDIVIFRSPVDPDRDLIKRCVAVGGQEVRVVDKVLYVDGKRVEEPPMAKHTDPRCYPASVSPRDNFGPYRVPPGHFFMMGDNRDNSFDSRYWLAVPRELIKGKAMSIYWSVSMAHGPLVHSSVVPDFLIDIGNFVANLPSLPGRVRYGRLGEVIH